MSRLSLRARLTVLYGVLSVVAGAVILTLLYLVVQARLDAELTGDSDSRVAALRQQAEQSGETTITMRDGSRISLDELVEQIRANEQDIRSTALDTLLVQGSGIILVIGLATAGTGWIVAGRGLRPLRAITTTAEQISRSAGPHRDLSRRIALTGRGDDIKRLADAFDAMLESLDRAFDGQRRFVASASHELRTPLALERAVIELEATRPGAHPDTVRLAERLLAVNTRNADLVDRLLTLADGGNELVEPVPVDLADVVADVLAQAPVGAPAGPRVGTELAAAPMLGDPVLLHQLVRNLVENAINHNVPGGWIRIATGTAGTASPPGTAGAQAHLAIANSGQRLLALDVDGLFEPFRRGRSDQAARVRTPGEDQRRGFGLGLAIVRAISDTHHGRITALPLEDGGLDLRITFPAAPATHP
ncbi:HAMP domain-containing histidine kinase [Frankia sp. CNm7]|uniref:histidine kinase n=1 Tax=Frankia nepalensis TaxID=1836974 RepID=A0A937UMJ1_9ACTN|nr:HAMP domain-containing sensor histidine kinase [Frankia nepalensis]MBL7495772.1 HAMP domain-containing histidine kinase [Frankia nepalensis]MBL7513015.1 HAMP domain-containing histidine kinase [Frankia nepalensis]MBL7523637.1 HAMP domain-containing histidine kinase [Frankia nepalensis]MBL7627118.1 HAMP domain-containing histidine kinase [Frankia nepalensis]